MIFIAIAAASALALSLRSGSRPHGTGPTRVRPANIRLADRHLPRRLAAGDAARQFRRDLDPRPARPARIGSGDARAISTGGRCASISGPSGVAALAAAASANGADRRNPAPRASRARPPKIRWDVRDNSQQDAARDARPSGNLRVDARRNAAAGGAAARGSGRCAASRSCSRRGRSARCYFEPAANHAVLVHAAACADPALRRCTDTDRATLRAMLRYGCVYLEQNGHWRSRGPVPSPSGRR